ncbi:hypothetical protein C0993_010873 [Termitomyces sp. T159_Od127]|nr:hypothetical protein C0993_010873 [Termitomyces sp. T159_Od127]
MSQLANPDTPLDALAPQNEAWTCLLHLEVQLTQASLTHHMTELSTLHQTTNDISQSLQALLECLSPITAPPPVTEPPPAALAVPPVAPVALAGLQMQIPCPILPDTYDGDHTSKECFFQSCFTYIHLSRDAFNSNTLKIAWVLSYMKARWVSIYAPHVLQHLRGVGNFIGWAAFKKHLQAKFFPIDLAKSAALVLHNKEQYGQEKQTLNEYLDSFQALVKQAAYPDGLQLCLMFWDGLHPTLMECIDNLAEG